MTILLVPGFMLDADLWTDMRPGLDAIAPVIEADVTRDHTIAGMADRAIASLRGPATVIGFSMGGYVAREIAYRAPDKVAALVLIATSSRGHDPAPVPADGPAFHQLGRGVVARSVHPEHRDDQTIARIQAMSRRLGDSVFRRQSALVRVDDTARLREITCPTLIIAAAQDQLRTLEESQVLDAGIANARLEVVETSGHMIPLEQPQALLCLLRRFVAALGHGGGSADASRN